MNIISLAEIICWYRNEWNQYIVLFFSNLFFDNCFGLKYLAFFRKNTKLIIIPVEQVQKYFHKINLRNRILISVTANSRCEL